MITYDIRTPILKFTRFKCPEKFNFFHNSFTVVPLALKYDLINLGELEKNSEIIMVFTIDLNRQMHVSAYKLFQNSPQFENYNVDMGNLQELVDIIEAPLNIKAYKWKGNKHVDIIVDGKDFHFYLFTADIEFDPESEI